MSNDAEKCADDLIDELESENARLQGIIERALSEIPEHPKLPIVIDIKEILNEATAGNGKQVPLIAERDAAIKKLVEDMIREIYGLANYGPDFHVESGKRFFDRKAKLWPKDASEAGN